MLINTLFMATMAFFPSLIDAHGDGVPGAPKIFGRRSALQLEALNAVRERAQSYQGLTTGHSDLKRQATGITDGQCGPGYGSCAEGYCCSEAGWCGTGTSYCMSPGEFLHSR